mgnify:CR=1 FL=1
MKIVGLVTAMIAMCIALNFATGLSGFVDLTSIAFIAIPVFAAFVAVGFKKQGVLVVQNTAIQVAIVGMLIGFIGILQNMSDPKALGPALAIMLLVVFYGVIVAGVSGLLATGITKKIETPPVWQRVTSVLLWVGICAAAMDGLTGLTAFIDPSSVLIVAALTAAMFGTTARERPKSLAQNLPAAAFLGVLIGVIAMMQHMSTPKLIGPAMAIAVLTLLYCNALSVLLKLAFPDTTLEDSPSHFTYLGFVLVFVMGATSVLLLSFM